MWKVGLRLNRTEGAQVCLLLLVSEGGVGDPFWESSSLLGIEWVEKSPSSPLLQSWKAPPACLSCSAGGLPPMSPGPMWPGGGFGG